MISNERPKTNKKLIVISVIVLTILTLNVSYSAFFDVKTQEEVNTFTAGNLEVTVNQNNTVNGSLVPTPDNELPSAETNPNLSSSEKSDWKYSEITIQNAGNLAADFMVTISFDTAVSEAERVNLQYLNIGIYDTGENKWLEFGTGKYYASLSSLNPLSSDPNAIPIIRNKMLAASNSNQKTYRIYIWLSQNTPVTEINKKINLKINVRSTTVEGQNSNNGQQDVTVKDNA